jgi:hypothetical protein
MTSEDIDRSYGNSPYFFYNHYPEEDKEETKEPSPLRSKMFNKTHDETASGCDLPEYPSA